MKDMLLQVEPLIPALRRYARALVRNRANADDLVQDTVERALRNLNQFVPDTRMDSWMFRIAQNLWIDKLRAQKVRAGTVNDLTEAEKLAILAAERVRVFVDSRIDANLSRPVSAPVVC